MDVLGIVVQAATAFAAKAVSESNSSAAVTGAYVAAASAVIDEAEKRHGERSPEWGEIVAAIGNVTDASTLLHGGTPVGRSPAVTALLREFGNRLSGCLQELIPPDQLAATDTILAALFDIRVDTRHIADQTNVRRFHPLGVSLDIDGNWRRLRVHNPNDLTAQGCSVQIIDYASRTQLAPRAVLPSRGFKFGWTTHGRDVPTRYADIPPAAHDYADLHQVLPEQGYFTHVAPGDSPHTFIPFWGLPEGTYTYGLAVASAGPASIPTTTLAIEATYDGAARLELRLAPRATRTAASVG